MKHKTYYASYIANYFLEKAHQEGMPVSVMKLLKLVYIAYGWVLALLHHKLFKEPIEAWKFGPVIPSLYYEFKHCGKEPICELATEYDPDSEEPPYAPKFQQNAQEEDILKILDKVWEVYGDRTASALMRLTHEAGTPWAKAYSEEETRTLDDEEIKMHFEQRIRYLVGGEDAKA